MEAVLFLSIKKGALVNGRWGIIEASSDDWLREGVRRRIIGGVSFHRDSLIISIWDGSRDDGTHGLISGVRDWAR